MCFERPLPICNFHFSIFIFVIVLLQAQNAWGDLDVPPPISESLATRWRGLSTLSRRAGSGHLPLQLRIITAISARPAQRPAVPLYFPAVVHPFTAFFAPDARNRAARQVLERNVDLDSFDYEQFIIRQQLV